MFVCCNEIHVFARDGRAAATCSKRAFVRGLPATGWAKGVLFFAFHELQVTQFVDVALDLGKKWLNVQSMLYVWRGGEGACASLLRNEMLAAVALHSRYSARNVRRFREI